MAKEFLSGYNPSVQGSGKMIILAPSSVFLAISSLSLITDCCGTEPLSRRP
jgi:hypothetical protein